MPKMLTCPGPPEHTFEHHGGRGRPPKYCDAHKPEKPGAKSASKSEPSVTGVTGVTDALTPAANPFIKKAQQQASPDNPFLKKAQAREETKPEPPKRRGGELIQQPENRPAKFSKSTEVVEIVDPHEHCDPEFPGITLHDIHRDTTGYWTCKITVNEETFDLEKRGGWLVVKPDGNGWRECKPNIAAFIQQYVRALTPKKDDKGNEIPPKGTTKMLEQVADKVVPLDNPRDDYRPSQTAALEQELSVSEEPCEICGEPSVTEIDETRLCRNCADELEPPVDQDGYNDLLSNPEQFDDPVVDQFSAILAEFGEEE